MDGDNVVASVWASGYVITLGSSRCPTTSTSAEASYMLCPIAESYDATTNTTKAMSLTGAPSVRDVSALLWTGTRVLTWGGYSFDPSDLNNIIYPDGGLYDPVNDTWTSIVASSISPPRRNFSAVWTGSEMIVWGGETGPEVTPEGVSTVPYASFQPAAGGAAYNPATGTWRSLATEGQPSPREEHAAVWTGSEMIIWGGGSYPNPALLDAVLSDGAAYNPATDSWHPLKPAPGGLVDPVTAWTGHQMVVWGSSDSSGYTNRGYLYDPATDSWQAMTTESAPTPRAAMGAVWTGSSFLVWGGVAGDPPYPLGDGAEWFPDAQDGGTDGG